jgi:hypothetical protein
VVKPQSELVLSGSTDAGVLRLGWPASGHAVCIRGESRRGRASATHFLRRSCNPNARGSDAASVRATTGTGEPLPEGRAIHGGAACALSNPLSGLRSAGRACEGGCLQLSALSQALEQPSDGRHKPDSRALSSISDTRLPHSVLPMARASEDSRSVAAPRFLIVMASRAEAKGASGSIRTRRP